MSSCLLENEIEISEQNIRSNMKPNPSIEDVFQLIPLHWESCKDIIKPSIKQIESYDDANFYLEVNNNSIHDNKTTSFLIKFYNAMETISGSDLLNGLGAMLQCINDNLKIDIQVPTIVSPTYNDFNNVNNNINYIMMNDCKVQDGSMQTIAVRVFKWIDGTTLSRIEPDFQHMYQLGQAIGEVSQCLVGFHHPSFHRKHMWDLAQFESYHTMKYIDFIDDECVKLCIINNYQVYLQEILPIADQLPRSVIMADCNDANVIVSRLDDSTTTNNVELMIEVYKVAGLIDFSDAVETWSCNEIAIAMAYSLLTSYGKQSPYHAMGGLLLGYIQKRRLTTIELACLPVLIMIRLSMSVMIGAYAIRKDPHNEYLKLHSVPGKAAIRWLNNQPKDIIAHIQYFTTLQELIINQEISIEEYVLTNIIQNIQ